MIPYGAETGAVKTSAVLDRLGLDHRKYFLYVSRMEPENNALLVRECFEQVATPYKLALVGDAPYADQYIGQVRDTRDTRVVMPGAIYGDGYRELGSHCFAYIHATEVGGTHPALIEAMGRRSRRRRGAAVYTRNPDGSDQINPGHVLRGARILASKGDEARQRTLQLGCGDRFLRKSAHEASPCVAGLRSRDRRSGTIIAPCERRWDPQLR